MSTSTWGGVEHLDETYPPHLLTYLLKQMMLHFGAQGACIALHDETIGQMKIHAHVRFKSVKPISNEDIMRPHPQNRRVTAKLEMEPVPTLLSIDDLEEVTGEQSELFPVGSSYPLGHDLIGYIWSKNEAYTMPHEDYISLFHANELPMRSDLTPSHYLIVPIREATLLEELYGRKQTTKVLGIIILYHISPAAPGFQKQRNEALQYVERIALYLQNDKLRRTQRQMTDYLQLLQNISTAFPKSVMLSDLVENILHFVSETVDFSSMLLTLYDRDHDRLYDVFAMADGKRIDSLIEHPTIRLKQERPLWWEITQTQKRTILFSPLHDHETAKEYQELLTGVWGDQSYAESFALIPMKMFNRVIGALCLTSKRPYAYQPLEIQVLETMVQIVTVSIENAKLYERDRSILLEARQREAQLAAINSALQSINSVLNVTELLNNLVESAAGIVKVELCAFFEPTSSGDQLTAHTLYAPSSVQMVDDGSGLPVISPPKRGEPDEIINMIQLPFKGTFLEQMVHEGFSHLDKNQLAELALESNEAGKIFLLETDIESMLIVPLSYHAKFFGFLTVPRLKGNRVFRPKDIGTLLAICAHASGALRNAQLFEQREETNAELERLNRLKDEFLVTASHELRTPLTAISGYASQLKRQSARANPQQIQKFAAKIHLAAQQLTDLVGNMTEAAQIGPVDRKLDMRVEPVQVFVATEVAASMLNYNSDHHISLQITRDLWMMGDPPKVRQVLTNLLENATKYSLPHTNITVTAQSMQLNEVMELLSEDQVDHALLIDQGDIPVVLVRVTDHGEGILPADRLQIFEKFVRAPRSLTTPIRGSGLGLYICRRYVEAMGGKLWLEQSVPNEGSTFSFYLPQVDAPVESSMN